jgi:integrase
MKPKLAKKIKVKPKHTDLKHIDLLTDEEIKRLIKAAKNARERAIIMVLFETGCSVSELLRL